jgi:hypothetical protein
MSSDLGVDAEALREEVRSKYREVAANPHGSFHFHTGRVLAQRLGYDDTLVASLPDAGEPAFHPSHKRVFEETREPLLCARDLLHALQLHPASSNAPHEPSNGGRCQHDIAGNGGPGRHVRAVRKATRSRVIEGRSQFRPRNQVAARTCSVEGEGKFKTGRQRIWHIGRYQTLIHVWENRRMPLLIAAVGDLVQDANGIGLSEALPVAVSCSDNF